MEAQPSRMLLTLRECGALARILPEVDALFGVPQPAQHHPEVDTGLHILLVLDYAAAQDYPLPVRFAALTHDLGKGRHADATVGPAHHGHEHKSVELVEQLCERLRVPNDCRDLACWWRATTATCIARTNCGPATVLKLAFGRRCLPQPERFEELAGRLR